MDAWRAADRGLEALKHWNPNSKNEQCPGEQQWFALAAGLVGDAEAMTILDHAAGCRACAEQLKFAQSCLAQEYSESQGEKSSTPEWQRRIAAQMAAQEPAIVELPVKRHSRRIMFAAVAAILLAALTAVILPRIHRSDVGQLLAQAYTQDRTLEMRIPNAAHSAVRQRRSASRESLTVTDDPLLPPRNAIGALCKKAPAGKECILARAQLDLLDRRYQPALIALAGVPSSVESPEFLLTRALAEFEKGESEGGVDTSSYGQAIEDLSKVLRSEPHNTVALFNRALTYEKLNLRENAIADWRELLKTENDPGWAAEARQRLEDLEQKKSSRLLRLKSLYDPLEAYQVLIRAPAIDSFQSEAFLQHAIERWASPAAVSSVPSPVALNKLARILKRNHDDNWLTDFLHAPAVPTALVLLRSAISANSMGDPQRAGKDAALAAKLFAQAGNVPGVLRSRFELIYALHRQFKAAECIRQGDILGAAVAARSYSWLMAEVHIEIFGCHAMLGRFDRSRDVLQIGLRDSERYHFPNLHLRAVSFNAALERSEGMLNRAWSSLMSGLELFWGGVYPSDRGHEFYANLEFIAEEAKEFHLAEALQREALALTGESKRRDILAYDHFRLGAAAEIAGDHEIAREELELAHDLFHRLPPNEATRLYMADAEIALAKLEAAQGAIQPASNRLQSAAPEIAKIERLDTQFGYWMAQAEVERSQGRTSLERQRLERALDFAREGFKTLSSHSSLWAWRQQVEPAYMRLLEIEIQAPHDAAQALADWETFHGASNPHSLEPPIGNSKAKLRLLKTVGNLRGATLVAFVVFEDGVRAWVAGEQGVREFFIQVDVRKLKAEVQDFYRLCSASGSSAHELTVFGMDLYQRLLSPLETLLGPQQLLLIETDESLSGLPWSALIRTDGTYFGDAYHFAATPGLFYRLEDAAQEPTRSGEHVLIASPQAVSFRGEALEPLPHAEEEAARIARLFSGADYLKGGSANVERLLKGLSQATVFHFAGHAMGLEHGGELLLEGKSGRNVLSASELSGLSLKRCRLVVLSACSTATVERDITRNPDGLVDAFLTAGATNVIASRWDVDSNATAALMRRFYESLHEGHGVTEALKDARAYVRSLPGMNLPYYWAAFDLFSVGQSVQ
jgi:CHAT domain-containing protein